MTFAVFIRQIGFVPLMQRAINRATAERIKTLREVGITIIAARNGKAADPEAQFQRIVRVFDLNMRVNRIKCWMHVVINAITHLGTAAVPSTGIAAW
jgi:hypothetical protein